MTPIKSNPSADFLLASFLAKADRTAEADLEELCAAHPERATELRQAWSQHQRALQAFLDVGLDGSEDERDRPGHRAAGNPLAAGTTLGDFLLLELIGEGGMGQVWKAQQHSLQRLVALKLVRPERASERGLAMFAREGRAGGRLSHRGIVAVYAQSTTDGWPWIAMELVEGGRTLRELIDETSELDRVPAGFYTRVARIVSEAADAVHVAHEAKVIHRDLKPQNILLAEGDHPKVSDFGLARITDEPALSVTGEIAGTFLYMSPEQVAARRTGLDHRTDVFSLGAILYELLSLRRPFEGDTTQQVAFQILHEDPPDPRKIRSRVPGDLAVICGKCLEKDRDHRYPTMQAVAADLRRHLAGEPITARPPSMPHRTLKWARRHPTVSVAVVLCTLALAAVSMLLAINLRTNEDLRQTSRREQLRADQVLRLSSQRDLEMLEAEAAVLWPPHPEHISAYIHWLSRADELLDELPQHRATLEDLSASGSEADWWREQLGDLIANFEALVEPGTGLRSVTPTAVSSEEGWSVPRRLRFAQDLRDAFADDGEYGRRWAAALPELGAVYPGLDLTPQWGLVPLGEDPVSGFWEFWHLMSGEMPGRDDDGLLTPTESSGMVFLLLPGGSFWQGAQASEPSGVNYDSEASPREGPVRQVVLSPFFLSKYEMTQGQWQRLTGANPSTYRPGMQGGEHVCDLRHPVETMTWFQATVQAGRMGLALPTEAQWEYGARGGTDTPWWTGPDRESLRTFAAVNIADQAAEREGGVDMPTAAWPDFDDGYPAHAPVGTFTPNPFGMHEMHGNVWEWCLDGAGLYLSPSTGVARDPFTPPESDTNRSIRGGGFNWTSHEARSAYRYFDGPGVSTHCYGVRMARKVTD